MKKIFISPNSLLRKFFPLVRKLRYWAWKFNDRTAQRLIISGGKVHFMDVELVFPENMAMGYSSSLFWNGPDSYEASTSRTIALLAGRAKSFLDIGSNIGIYAIYVGVKFPQVKIHAFEPVPAIWGKNRRLHNANRLSENNVLNLALSDRDETQTMVLPIGVGGLEEEETATLRQDIWHGQENKVVKFEIPCVTLDAFTAANPLPTGLCAIKIDVENHEAAALRGGRQFLTTQRPWIVCEMLPNQGIDPATGTRFNTNNEAVKLLHEYRYVVFAITADGYFRMTPADFSRPREIKDFLLIPFEFIVDDVFYLSSTDVAAMLPKA